MLSFWTSLKFCHLVRVNGLLQAVAPCHIMLLQGALKVVFVKSWSNSKSAKQLKLSL